MTSKELDTCLEDTEEVNSKDWRTDWLGGRRKDTRKRPGIQRRVLWVTSVL